MGRWCLSGGAALAIALAVSPIAASAQPSPEADRLGAQVAHGLLAKVDFQQAFVGQNSGMAQMQHDFAGMHARPLWANFAETAMLQELQQDRPVFDRILGHALAGYFSEDELREGVIFMKGPGGEGLSDAVAASVAHQAQPAVSPQMRDAVQQLSRDPAGKSFLQKLSGISGAVDSAEKPLDAAIFTGWLRRFVDEAEAEDARSAPGSGPDQQVASDAATRLFADFDFRTTIEKPLEDSLVGGFNLRPEWPDLAKASLDEVFTDDSQAQISRSGAVVLPRFFTADELRILDDALRSPDGHALAEVMGDASRGVKPTDSPALERVAARIARTEAGRAFLHKFANSHDMGVAFGEEFGALITLDLLRRFVDKIEAEQPG